MLQPLLRVRDFYWHADEFRPPLPLHDETAVDRMLPELGGRFSFATALPDGKVMLVRDRLGINKLFFAIHDSGQMVVSNYLADLLAHGVPLDTVYSVPAGHSVRLDLARERLTLRRYVDFGTARDDKTMSTMDVARAIRQKLEMWFARLAAAFPDREVCVCLSGGLDSSTIAAFAAAFPRVTAYTYAYAESARTMDEDLWYAGQVAQFLGMRFRPVLASAADLLSVVDEALCYGQDWRDFNVHCAMVNAVLARAIEDDARQSDATKRPLVLSGDLLNEFLADYTPVSYNGQEYYRLPRLEPGALRLALIRGLDAGDREIGVFNHHGIDVIQPYAFLLDDYLRLPGSFLAFPGCKQALVREIAGDRLPACVLDRAKVRAQIGTSGEPTGILPLLAGATKDAKWLRSAFRRRFCIDDDSFLDRFVRFGVYRFLDRFPERTGRSDGYLA